MYKTLTIGKINTSKTELIDIAKAWLAISLAFTIAFAGLHFTSNFLAQFLTPLLISMLTVGIGFLLHEMAHKFAAQRYGCVAEFRAFNEMLFLAIAMSFLGFVFAAPGAVMISGMITRKENGIISFAGPITNYVLALLFLGLSFFLPAPTPILSSILASGFQINLWLGLFNMIPFLNFDGKKILAWNKFVWGGMVLFGIAFMFLI